MYPKLAEAYFNFVQFLCQDHLEYLLVQEPPATTLHVIELLQEGLNHQCASFAVSCSAIESLSAFWCRSRGNGSEATTGMKSVLDACPQVFANFLQTLFYVLVYIPAANHWALSGALFTLIVLDAAVRMEGKRPAADTDVFSRHTILLSRQ